LRNIPNLVNIDLPTNENSFAGSNIFSVQEGILMRWCEINYEIINK